MNAAERAEYLDNHHLVVRGWRSASCMTVKIQCSTKWR